MFCQLFVFLAGPQNLLNSRAFFDYGEIFVFKKWKEREAAHIFFFSPFCCRAMFRLVSFPPLVCIAFLSDTLSFVPCLLIFYFTANQTEMAKEFTPGLGPEGLRQTKSSKERDCSKMKSSQKDFTKFGERTEFFDCLVARERAAARREKIRGWRCCCLPSPFPAG